MVLSFPDSVAMDKYSNQKSNSCCSGLSSGVFLNIWIKDMFLMVDFRYHSGGFKVNMHSAAWTAFP